MPSPLIPHLMMTDEEHEDWWHGYLELRTRVADIKLICPTCRRGGRKDTPTYRDGREFVHDDYQECAAVILWRRIRQDGHDLKEVRAKWFP